MSEKFTASNGVVISTGAGSQRGGVGFSHSNTLGTLVGGLSKLQLDAFREFFLHERDQELGRWRDPESPERVVVPGHEDGWVQVWNEVGAESEGTYTRSSVEIHFSNPHYPCAATASRYFAAHPLPKPWHDAKPGEVWAVTWEGVESACVVELQDGCVRGRAFVPTDGKRETPGVMASIVTAGRRVWPEAVES